MHHITLIRTVTAYLLVTFDYGNCFKDAQTGQEHQRKNNIQGEHVLGALHESIEFSSRNLKYCAIERLECTTIEKRIFFQMMFSLYDDDVPEAEEMLSIK